MAAPLENSAGTFGSDELYDVHLPTGQAPVDKGPHPSLDAALFLSEGSQVCWYIDGFNLYHAVHALNRPALKWLDLRSLAASYLQEGQTLGHIRFFTALNTWDAVKRGRHVNYITALEVRGVTVHRANFDSVNKWCRGSEQYCKFNEEKQADVGIAVSALSDAYDSNAGSLFFLTADSDQVPTLRHIRQRFPQKKVLLIAPPGRLKVARDLGRHADSVFQLTAGRLAEHLLPPSVKDSRGRTVATRPSHYAPHIPA